MKTNSFLRNLLADLAKLRRPVTAASVVAFVLAMVEPLGLNFTMYGQIATGVLVGIGVVTAYIERLRGAPLTVPATLPNSNVDPDVIAEVEEQVDPAP